MGTGRRIGKDTIKGQMARHPFRDAGIDGRSSSVIEIDGAHGKILCQDAAESPAGQGLS